MARVGAQALSADNLIYKYLPIHIAEGIKAGEFTDAPVLVMLDLIVGAGVVAVARLAAGMADEAYLRAVLLTLMRGLGLRSDRTESLCVTCHSGSYCVGMVATRRAFIRRIRNFSLPAKGAAK